MASKTDDPLRMQHMIKFARKAIGFSARKSRADLDKDELLCLALVRLIEMIGEAAARITTESRDCHSEIPWAKIVGMRNRLVHGYDQVDLDLLWQTIERDLKPLVEQLEKIIPLNDPDQTTDES